jgi:hypothetical protein
LSFFFRQYIFFFGNCSLFTLQKKIFFIFFYFRYNASISYNAFLVSCPRSSNFFKKIFIYKLHRKTFFPTQDFAVQPTNAITFFGVGIFLLTLFFIFCVICLPVMPKIFFDIFCIKKKFFSLPERSSST